MNKATALSAILSVLLLVIPNAISPAAASPFTGGTTAFTLMSRPSLIQLNGQPTLKANFQNNVNVTIPLAVVYAVVHNGMGQTVLVYGSSTVTNVATGANSTAYVVLFGITTGAYNVNVFATLGSGTAISNSTTVSITI